MLSTKQTIGIFVVIIMIIIGYLYMRSIFLEELVGFYVAPDSFTSQNGLTNLSFIVSDVSYRGRVSGFLVMDDITVPFTFMIPIGTLRLQETPVCIDYDNQELPLPTDCMITLSHGHLMIEDSETIFIAANWVPIF